MLVLLFVPSPRCAQSFPRQSGLENLRLYKTQELQSLKNLILLNFLMLKIITILQKHHPILKQNQAIQKK